MAIIWKCDRCGKIYEKNDKTFRPHEIIGGPNGRQTADLCDQCNNMLEVFLSCDQAIVAFPDHLKGHEGWYSALAANDIRERYYFKMGSKFDAPDKPAIYPPSADTDVTIPIQITKSEKEEVEKW